jgi:predicted GNAT superfamily acetyltransferase
MRANAELHSSEQIVIREIDNQSEIRACEELQKEVWGVPDLDVVPMTQLVAAKAAGGALIGAFDGESLIGFAYGFVGYENGRTTHHSHMLAVKPAYRNFSIGYKLKLAQREFVLAQGITEMTWTFDPLRSLNAHFNFARLGVISDRYLIDFYGNEAASFLHRNGTDRLWVTWPLASRRTAERIEFRDNEFDIESFKPLVKRGNQGEPIGTEQNLSLESEKVSIEIPSDIHSMEKTEFVLAADWRKATRSAFREAFANGYVAVGFAREELAGKYLLVRGGAKRDFLSE